MTNQTAAPSTAPTAADLDTARLLHSRLGISPADLLTAAEQRTPPDLHRVHPGRTDCRPPRVP
jgi:hypothetical protein